MPIYQRENGIWYIDIKTQTGQRIRRSSGTKNKTEAQELHDKLAYEQWRIDRLGDKPKRIWDEAVLLWIQEKGGEKKSIKADISRLRHLQSLRGLNLNSISRSMILETVNSLPCSKATKNRYIALIRAILRKAKYDWQWIDDIPQIPLYKEPSKRVRWITVKEAQCLISKLPSYMALMAVFSLATGLRQSNVFHLKWCQVDISKRAAWFGESETKSEHSLGVALNEMALDVLKMQRGKHPIYVFVNSKGNPIQSLNSKLWKKAVREAGLLDFRWHDLRHTWASWLAQKGVPIHTLKEMGGWESLEMVQRYAHLSSEHLQQHASVRVWGGACFVTVTAATKTV